ncbi:hypothetical protein KUH03_42205 [Sphingobacterium sp. E70]|uniref:hypothetical protein n=1 Tax=Sphingobacterium sp. E70 TaxID=2853439 RepID=UPI00211BB2CA|nr:hypothetical protein [Sphingobacterium sp. E70]ULT25330.1 hypothetical protein KUH03_42205 [Sphingobacterium sp. E70]
MNIKFNRIITGFGLFIITASVLTACGNSADGNKLKAEKEQAQAVKEVEEPKVADVSFKDKAGNVVKLSDLKGRLSLSISGLLGVRRVYMKCRPLIP